MAVISVKKKYATGELGSSQSDDARITKNGRVVYTVVCDSKSDTEYTVEQSSSIPIIGYDYPDTSYFPVTGRHIERTGPITFEVIVEYAQTYTESPTAEPPDVSWDWVESEVEIDISAHGNPICNVNYEAFNPAVTRMQADLVCTISVNQSNYDVKFANQYILKTNSTPFMASWDTDGIGFAAGDVLCKTITGHLQWANGIAYWRNTYVFSIRKGTTDKGTYFGGWTKKIWNQGYKYKKVDAAGAPLSPIKYETAIDDNGVPLNEPIPLKLNGAKWREGIDDMSLQVWIMFDVYESIDFAPLGFM